MKIHRDMSLYVPGVSKKVKATYDPKDRFTLNEKIIDSLMKNDRASYGDSKKIDVYLNTKDSNRIVVKGAGKDMEDHDLQRLVGKGDNPDRRTYSYKKGDIYKVTLANPNDPGAYSPGGMYADRYNSIIKDDTYYKQNPFQRNADKKFKAKVDNYASISSALRGIDLKKVSSESKDNSVDWTKEDIFDYLPHGYKAKDVNKLPKEMKEELFRHNPIELAQEEDWPIWDEHGNYTDVYDLTQSEIDERIKAWPAYDECLKYNKDHLEDSFEEVL